MHGYPGMYVIQKPTSCWIGFSIFQTMHCIIETVQGNYLVPSQESNTPAWADAEAYIRSSKVKIECDREFTDADPLKGKSLPYSFRHLLLTGHTEPPSGWTWMHENDIEQRAKSDDVRAMIAYMDPRPLAPPGWQPTHHALEHPPKSYADDFTLPQHFAKLTQILRNFKTSTNRFIKCRSITHINILNKNKHLLHK